MYNKYILLIDEKVESRVITKFSVTIIIEVEVIATIKSMKTENMFKIFS